MATTTNWSLTLLEVGQKEKEVTINTNMTELSNRIPRFLGRLAANPSEAGVPLGSSFFNTATSKMVFLTQVTPTVIWSNAA
jgi:hypothetical protein